jgi:hypothetical protein
MMGVLKLTFCSRRVRSSSSLSTSLLSTSSSLSTPSLLSKVLSSTSRQSALSVSCTDVLRLIYAPNRLDYVEEKRKIYAPDAPAITASSSVPKNPYAKSAKPFSAWGEHLISETGFPTLPQGGKRDDREKEGSKKRGADDSGEQTREILYDGVRFTARKVGGSVELVDEEKIGTGEGQWPFGKVFRFTISKKDGSSSGDVEGGPKVMFQDFKKRLEPIAKPAFVSVFDNREIAGLPSGDKAMKVEEEKKEFPTRLTAPPTIATASETKKEEDAPTASTVSAGQQAYPAKGQASFKDVVSEEALAKLKSEVGELDGRKIEWTRVSGSSCFPPSLLALSSADHFRACRGRRARPPALPRPLPRRTSFRTRRRQQVRRWTWWSRWRTRRRTRRSWTWRRTRSWWRQQAPA